MSYPCPYLTHPVHVAILSLPVLTHHSGDALGVHIVIMLGGDHGVKWLGQVLADNIQILGGPMQGFVEWGATLAAMHDQPTQKRGNTAWSCHAEGRHGLLSGGPHTKMPYASPLHRTHL